MLPSTEYPPRPFNDLFYTWARLKTIVLSKSKCKVSTKAIYHSGYVPFSSAHVLFPLYSLWLFPRSQVILLGLTIIASCPATTEQKGGQGTKQLISSYLSSFTIHFNV